LFFFIVVERTRMCTLREGRKLGQVLGGNQVGVARLGEGRTGILHDLLDKLWGTQAHSGRLAVNGDTNEQRERLASEGQARQGDLARLQFQCDRTSKLGQSPDGRKDVLDGM